MHLAKFIIIVSILFVCILHQPQLFAQRHTIDSLEQELKKKKSNIEKIPLYFSLHYYLLGYDVGKANQYLEAGYMLAKEEKDTFYIAGYFYEKAARLFELAKYDSSFQCTDSAILFYDAVLNSKKSNAAKIAKARTQKANCLIEKGVLFAKRFQFQESVKYYLASIREWEKSNDPGRDESIATIYNNISSDYFELEQFQNALEYDLKALPFREKKNNDLLAIGYMFVADDYGGLLKFDSAERYIEKARPLVEKYDKHSLNVRFYGIIGDLYLKKKEWARAIQNFEKSIASAKKINDAYQMVGSNEGMATAYMQLGELVLARTKAKEALEGADSLGLPKNQLKILQLLTNIEELSGNPASAFLFQKKYLKLSDSIKKEEMQRRMNELETKYQSAKKGEEITRLQKDKQIQSLSIRQKTTLNYILGGSVGVLILFAFLAYRNLRHRQLLAKQSNELHQQRIRELEKDRQLIAVDSMLKGQEEERTRLAKDLHDGLGGMLSGVKFSLMNMKTHLIIDHENVVVFERSLDMLDTSIQELRRVAHNMMPEALVKFGLDEALKDYCDNINSAQIVQVKYQSFGMDQRLESNMEIIIYRIVQELFANIFKHAKATEVLVQLLREGNRISIAVEDNGKGFDVNELENSKGAGWANIRSRVNYLRGKLDLHSETGRGTSVNIEISA